jgi:UDP-N-acetylglucosamine acyltransferase
MTQHGIRAVGIDPRAQIDAGATIGPYCSIGPRVRIGAGTVLESHVTIRGKVTLGAHNHLHSGVVMGRRSRHAGAVVIGANNVFRESVTVQGGGPLSDQVTSIGDHNYLMACTHVGSGCRLDNHILIANASKIGSQAHVQNHAFLSGGVVVRPKASIGQHAFVSILCRVRQDVPPFMIVEGLPPRPRCVNLVGLNRRGFSEGAIRALVKAHRLVYRDKIDLPRAFEILQQSELPLESVGALFDFIEAQRRGFHGRALERGCRPPPESLA